MLAAKVSLSGHRARQRALASPAFAAPRCPNP